MAKTSRDAILDAAERRVRRAGYNGFSFRDIAEDVGVKSASVHHHFPTKEALVTALARRYTDRFIDGLATPAAKTSLVASCRKAFRESLEQDGQMCLCGMLGAESAGLPGPVAAETRSFFIRTAERLAAALEGRSDDPRRQALGILAQLEGAMILARSLGRIEAFDEATASLA